MTADGQQRQHGAIGHQPRRLLPPADGAGSDRAPSQGDLPCKPCGAARGAVRPVQGCGDVSGGGVSVHGGGPVSGGAQTMGQPRRAVHKTGGVMLVEQVGYGYRGPPTDPRKRDPLMSGYSGLPAGVVRSAYELGEVMQGRSVNYCRAPLDEGRQATLRRHLLAQIAKERMT
jgi:hypothetical protein